MKEYLDEISKIVEKQVNEQIEKKYSYLLADKKKMSEELYLVMSENYEKTPFEERKDKYKKDMCRCCRFNWDCDKSIIPENILKPVQSDRDWFPPKIGCEDFEWD